jgi:hypothetical protein
VVGRVALASLTLLLVMRVKAQQMPRESKNLDGFWRHGNFGQRRTFQPDCLGVGICCVNSKCDNASVHSNRCAFYDLRCKIEFWALFGGLDWFSWCCRHDWP